MVVPSPVIWDWNKPGQMPDEKESALCRICKRSEVGGSTVHPDSVPTSGGAAVSGHVAAGRSDRLRGAYGINLDAS